MTYTLRTITLHKRSDYDSFGIYLGEDVPSGVYIITVDPNSPASVANVQPGDRIIAVNGQAVSSMSRGPQEMITHLAKSSQSLTLALKSSNIVNDLHTLPNNTSSVQSSNNLNGFTPSKYHYYDNSKNPSNSNNGVDHQLEHYLKKLFSDDSLHITYLSSGNQNEYLLTSNKYSLPPHHHHQKQRSHRTKPAYTNTNIRQTEHMQPSSPRRSMPSMGTSHAVLRNSQVSSKDNGINPRQEAQSSSNTQPTINNQSVPTNAPVVTSNPEPYPPPNQSHYPPPPPQYPNDQTNNYGNPQAPSVNSDGLREARMRRSPHFRGFGFHIQFNNIYYIVSSIEPNSPAFHAGLRPNDVIRRLNNQPADRIPHHAFVQIVDRSTEIVLSIQSYDDYLRANPQLSQQQNSGPNVNSNTNNTDSRKNVLDRAISMIKSR